MSHIPLYKELQIPKSVSNDVHGKGIPDKMAGSVSSSDLGFSGLKLRASCADFPTRLP